MYTISVEIDVDLAQRLVEDPTNWDHRDKVELLEAIGEELLEYETERPDDE